MKWLRAFIVATLCAVPVAAGAWWQSRDQVATSAGSSFQGPGDVVSGATVWGSCARVYQASLASTATSLCDLVDSAAPTVVICTLRGSSTGFVDLAGTYCTGSVTPSVKCAAATGAKCNISKIYDQTGAGNFWTQATAASQPTLTFSALNGLPGITCAGACLIPTTTALTQAQPFSFSYVAERTGVFTTLTNVLSISGGALRSGMNNVANQAEINGGASLIASATDSAFHAFQAVANGASSSLVPDGVASNGAAGATGLSATQLRLMTSNGGGTSLTGITMEAGMWPAAFNATQYGNLNTNQHSAANGYNF